MRADVFLAAHGLAESREKAKRLISEGAVSIDGAVVRRPSCEVAEDTPLELVKISEAAQTRYVGRGGLKLEAALDAFGISVVGAHALDIGASTGGFTDCLLMRGASRVTAVDSGHGQLAQKLLNDERVRSLEGVNARYLNADIVGCGYDIIVMDVSFISQTLILPVLPPLLGRDGVLISLIKPQFEVGRAYVGKGGIVKSSSARERAVENVRNTAAALGFSCMGVIMSPIEGGDGNTEYLAAFSLAQ